MMETNKTPNTNINLDISANVNTNANVNTKRKSGTGAYSIIAFILALIPILFFKYCTFKSSGSANENSEGGAAFWLFIIYFWTIGPVLACLSIVFAIMGLRTRLKALAIISLIIQIAPIIFVFAYAFR